ncbi:Serine carboxypeptidase [Paramarasmius palmivorus]|uniref:Serine carboxypeptidase n=1 Tax=Paramarasmius palmivorus TaxID=297713 RepID=A0AAW0BQK2_9AGAR
MKVAFLLAACSLVHAIPPGLHKSLGGQGVNLWKLDKLQLAQKKADARRVVVQNPSVETRQEEFPPQWFEQPVDHFSSASNETFQQRYWFSTRHYTPGSGGPVFVLDGGETSGEDRIPFLDTGILNILTRAVGGIGVVLEHRYYGESFVTPNLTTDSLRFLNNEQAAADSARFMAKIKFPGIDEDLTAPSTPWIYYGGSYAGARSAHMRILYPELVFGAIASSGVTHAALSNWEYMDVIRNAANATCSNHLHESVKTIDAILAKGNATESAALKARFGITDLAHDVDFVSLITSPLGSWQSKNWDPAVGSTAFDSFCNAINQPPSNLDFSVTFLDYERPERLVDIGDGLAIDFALANYADYIKQRVVARCPASATQEACFGTFDDSQYQETGLDQDWRLWQFQVCTQWGYFTTSPPSHSIPRIVSDLLTLEYLAKICQQAYLPGEFFTVPNLPNVSEVNVLGDFDIAADRLAIIDGEVDPWMPDTPHSTYYAKDRPDTLIRPFKLIPGAVHHWDENGLENIEDEPEEIQKIHTEMIEFVMEWLKDWKKD